MLASLLRGPNVNKIAHNNNIPFAIVLCSVGRVFFFAVYLIYASSMCKSHRRSSGSGKYLSCCRHLVWHSFSCSSSTAVPPSTRSARRAPTSTASRSARSTRSFGTLSQTQRAHVGLTERRRRTCDLPLTRRLWTLPTRSESCNRASF